MVEAQGFPNTFLFVQLKEICQWRIQDFPEGGANPGGWTPTYYLANENWNENEEIMGQRGASLAPLDPPMSADENIILDFKSFYKMKSRKEDVMMVKPCFRIALSCRGTAAPDTDIVDI